MFQTMQDFHTWLDERYHSHPFSVIRTPLDQLAGWSVDPRAHTIRHDTGRFFSIDGLEVETDHGPVRSWAQPIIDQPECGILGILVKEFDGVPHFLMQAKMEPGNVNLIQLSPTVQATRSNYTGVHGGSSVPYLDYFREPGRNRVLSDGLQSEQGSWFLNKRNRNMILETTDDVPVGDDFCWLRADQLGALFRTDDMVNMDTRSVLSGYPFSELPEERGDTAPSTMSLRSWFTDAKSRYHLTRRQVALRDVKGWICSQDSVNHELNLFFSVIGVDVVAGSREVASWSQPMLAPTSEGVVAFLVRQGDGELEVLLQAHTQAGTLDVVEMAPTVQCTPANYEMTAADARPPMLDYVLSASPEQVLLDVVQSEEGGRFYHARNRHLLVSVPTDFEADLGPDFHWAGVRQLAEMAQIGNYLNVEARSLLACLRFLG